LKEITKRILVAVAGIPLGITLIWLGSYYFLALLLIISTIGIWELHKMYDEKKSSLSLTISFNIILLVTAFINIKFSAYYYLIPIQFFIFFLISSIYGMLNTKKNTFELFSGNLFIIVYITLGFMALLFIREYLTNGFYIFLTIILGIWICDSFAYFTGISIGRHKLWKRISPKKTWEGAAGGFAGSLLTVFLMNYIFKMDLGIYNQFIIGSIIGIAGQFGDLFESKLKRDAGVKDSSDLIPGHGGILDRFDSLIFVAPIIIFYFLLI
jgi:phosphatidate cytidylyltransferase